MKRATAVLDTLTPSPTRRRRPTPAEEAFAESLLWRAKLMWRIRDYVPDAGAEIDAIVWELTAAGEIDQARLYWSTLTRLRTVKRNWLSRRWWEEPVNDDDSCLSDLPDDDGDVADTVTDRVAAAQIVERLPAPSPSAMPWVQRAMGPQGRHDTRLAGNLRQAGSRWAAAARTEIAVAL